MLPRQLNPMMVEEFSHSLLVGGLSPKTVRDILSVLKSILAYVRRQPDSFVPEIEIVYPRDRRQEMRVLTPEEQTRFIRYLLNDMDAPKFGGLLALLLGLRIGELCALRWEDISFQDKTLHVRFTMQRLQTPEPEGAHPDPGG